MLATNLVLGYLTGDFAGRVKDWQTASQQLKKLENSNESTVEQIEAAEQAKQAAWQEVEPLKKRKGIHFFMGVAASLVTLLVNSITVTYFVGTSRWCKEVVETYQLDPDLAMRSTRLKRRTFPWAVLGMLTIVAHAGLGAASDASSALFGGESVRFAHQMSAWLTMMLVGWSLWIQATNISANYAVIQEILDKVRSIRIERGLETDDAAPTAEAG